jgi:hypothetical protein
MSRHKRPRCVGCNRRLSINFKFVWDKVPDSFGGFMSKRRRDGIRGYGYGDDGVFCTLRCGYLWALNRVRQERGDQ